MTNITVEYEGERIVRLESIGHAGNQRVGENIVCAAVSVLMQTCVNALEAVAGIAPALTVNEGKAQLAIALPKANAQTEHDAQIILRTTVLGLTDISHEYPRLVKLNILKGRNLP